MRHLAKADTRQLVALLLQRAEEAEYSIADLVRRSGVSRTTIWRLRQGQGGQLRNVLALARALGVRLVSEART